MPRTELPQKPLIGIHPAINCRFCAHRDRGVEVKDSDMFFTTACPRFSLTKFIYCRELDHWVHWKVCAWRHYTDTHSCCVGCQIGEGMVEVSHALGHVIPE